MQILEKFEIAKEVIDELIKEHSQYLNSDRCITEQEIRSLDKVKELIQWNIDEIEENRI